MKKIDLRSDTVTQPTEEMRQAMAQAEVGDDVYRDDPTVLRLEKITAEKMHQEAALFFPTGTQTNLTALLCHCERGEEYICGNKAHIYQYEAGGGAVLGSIQPQPIPIEEDGTLAIGNIREVMKPDDVHFAKTKLLCIENTFWGKALPMDYLREVTDFAKRNKLSTHLDGARIFNAAQASKVKVGEIAELFDSVSVCLSKGLGAPLGSVLCGSSSMMKKAIRWRKMLGGGMRQAGIAAAAGILAIEKMSLRLEEDHCNARLFVDLLNAKTSLQAQAFTNMAFLFLTEGQAQKLQSDFQKHSILATVGLRSRFVFHHQISSEDVHQVANVIIQSLNAT